MLAILRLCFAVALIAGPAISQGKLDEVVDRLDDTANWEELCRITDCDQFPIGYYTYAFGPSVYYFPTMGTMTVKPPNIFRGAVKAGGYYELGSDGNVLRSLSIADSTTIPSCCHHLLTFYGLADTMPVFRESRDGNRMPSAFAAITSFDQPRIVSSLRQLLGYGNTLVPPIRNLIGESPTSYNDDFWLLRFDEPNKRGIRYFEVLSKRPMLNGHFVFGQCARICSFRTLRLKETVDEVRPQMFLGEMLLTGENMFLCSPEEFENGCDPAPEIFDQVTVMLSLIEEMFDRAAVFPDGRNEQ